MPGRRASTLRGILFALVGVALANPSPADASRIGLYTDESGSSCNFSGTSPGIITAYVVVKADPNGVRALRFAAPVPSCLDATFLAETPADGVVSIGSSPTGISLAFQSCVIYNEPAVALAIHYMTNGSTEPCCAFPLVADPIVGEVEITDCAFQTAAVTTTTAHFNADSSCPCDDGTPPEAPSNPTPANFAIDVDQETLLSWTQSPADLDIASYDVYFGSNTVPGLVATTTETTFDPPVNLQINTPYYWRVVARDLDGLETSSPTWTFTTTTNDPPAVPSVVYPPHQSATFVQVTFQWTGSDPDGDPLVYDLYLGTVPNPPLLASGLTVTEYASAFLDINAEYRWRIVARDPHGHATTSPTWVFTTDLLAHRPTAAQAVYPTNLANDVSTSITLDWSVTDPNGDPLTCDLYFGTELSPPLLATGITVTEYPMTPLAVNTTYRWKIVARDPSMYTSTSQIYSFTTGSDNFAPNPATAPNPANLATGVSRSPTLSWEVTDPNGDAMTYRLNFGLSNSPPVAATDLTATSYALTSLVPGVTYFWRVTARDSHGAETIGSVWTFTTATVPTGAPELPLELALGRNHPNPFNPQTVIPYSIPAGEAVRVRLVIHDASGRFVRVLVDEDQAGGAREVRWNGDDESGASVASGVYFCVLSAGEQRRTQKLVLLK